MPMSLRKKKKKEEKKKEKNEEKEEELENKTNKDDKTEAEEPADEAAPKKKRSNAHLAQEPVLRCHRGFYSKDGSHGLKIVTAKGSHEILKAMQLFFLHCKNILFKLHSFVAISGPVPLCFINS